MFYCLSLSIFISHSVRFIAHSEGSFAATLGRHCVSCCKEGEPLVTDTLGELFNELHIFDDHRAISCATNGPCVGEASRAIQNNRITAFHCKMSNGGRQRRFRIMRKIDTRGMESLLDSYGKL